MINSKEFQDAEHKRLINQIATEAVDMCDEMKSHIYAVPSVTSHFSKRMGV